MCGRVCRAGTGAAETKARQLPQRPQAGGARKGAGSGLWGAVTRLRLFDVVSALET